MQPTKHAVGERIVPKPSTRLADKGYYQGVTVVIYDPYDHSHKPVCNVFETQELAELMVRYSAQQISGKTLPFAEALPIMERHNQCHIHVSTQIVKDWID